MTHNILKEQMLQPSPDGIKPRIHPLSEGQKGLWFLHRMVPDNLAYNEYNAVKIKDALDIEKWKAAWLKLVERHAVLRTTYGVQNDEPVQKIHDSIDVPVKVIDASAWSDAELKEEILKAADIPYDLENGPIFRLYLYRISSTEYVQLLTVHHIANDGFTKDLWIDEFRKLYAGAHLKKTLAYTDFVKWESDLLASAKGEELWRYWHKQLAGELPVLNLATDKPRPTMYTFRGDSFEVKLDDELVSGLNHLKFGSISLFQIMLSAYYVLLYRYTHQTDILVNIPNENRRGENVFRDVAGYFISIVVFRADLAGNPSFKELLKQVAVTAFDAMRHEAVNTPFTELVRHLKLKRDFSRNPISSVMFNWRKIVWGETVSKQELLPIEPYLLEEQRGAAYDLTLEVIEFKGELSLRWNYNTDLFNSETIDRMAGHYLSLLKGIVADPEMPIAQLPLLTEEELDRLLVDWNRTTADFPKEKCIHKLFEEQVKKRPDAVAVLFEDRHLTYGELNLRANQLAHYLKKLGVAPDALVGIFMDRSLEMVVSIYAILKAGGAYIPIDPSYPRDRVTYILDNSKASIIVTQRHLIDRLTDHKAEIVCLDKDWTLVAQEPSHNPASPVTSRNLAYAIYTSGSTGTPKGVMIEHLALVNHMHWMQTEFPLTTEDNVFQKTPFSFDASVWEFYAALLTGGRLVIARPYGHQDPAYIIDTINRNNVTILQVVPTMLHMLLEDGDFTTCRTLKRVYCGGELLKTELVTKFKEVQQAELINLYGPTEATIDAGYHPCSQVTTSFAAPIGRPIYNTQMFILDDFFQPTPVGVAGELYIGGALLARGYLNRPDLTAELFFQHTFNNNLKQRIYKTGDIARYLPDGNIELLGRADNQVKIRGYRVELGEIENQIIKFGPEFAQVLVIPQKDISGTPCLVAYIVVGKLTPAINELREFLNRKLPDYMVPSDFVFIESFPLLPNGKIDQRALPAPQRERSLSDADVIQPKNSLERFIAEVWQDVLKINNIGFNDNFFDLGGHSLLMMKVISKLSKKLNQKLTALELLQYTTIRKLAEYIAGKPSVQLTPDSASVRTELRIASKNRKNKRRRRRSSHKS
jgi:amino acid adenylation domain-containing protein